MNRRTTPVASPLPRTALGAALLVGLFLVTAAAEDEGPTVRIESPSAGWSVQRIVKIAGTARGEGIRRMVLVINGAEKEVPVDNGRFETQEVVSPGENTIRALVEDRKGRVASDSVTFYAKVPDRDLKITANWDTAGTDMDLHVVDPKGETCMYNHKETKIGGKLDIDVTDGFGPETFTQANAVPGTYKVFLHYYGPSGGPETVATVWIVLYEGTPKERKERREIVLMRQNEKPLVLAVEVE